MPVLSIPGRPSGWYLDRVLPWVAALLTVAWRATFLVNRGLGQSPAHFFDDALITLRYSVNLAAGSGLVYNPGEAVLGTTTPLYALLMTPAAMAGLHLPWTAAIFNMLIDAAIVFALVRMGRGKPVFQILAPTLFILHPDILLFSANGMEMSLVVGLALLTAHLYWQGREVLAGLGAAAMVVCRIDGVLFVAGLVLLGVTAQRRIPWRFGLTSLLAFLPWALFALHQYGGIIPASAEAKKIWYTGVSRFNVLDLAYSDEKLLPLAIIGFIAVFCWRRDGEDAEVVDLLRSMIAWMVVFSGFFIALAVQMASWYRVPQHATVVLLAALGGEAIWRAAPRIHSKARTGLLIATVIAAVLHISVSDLRGPLGRHYFAPLTEDDILPSTSMHVATGRWLARHAEGSTVMAGNIGHIGWESGCNILDSAGLVSPQVLPYVDPVTRNRSAIIAAFRPDYLALERREVEEMREAIDAAGYVLVQSFPYETDPKNHQSPYRIYARSDHAGD